MIRRSPFSSPTLPIPFPSPLPFHLFPLPFPSLHPLLPLPPTLSFPFPCKPPVPAGVVSSAARVLGAQRQHLVTTRFYDFLGATKPLTVSQVAFIGFGHSERGSREKRSPEITSSIAKMILQHSVKRERCLATSSFLNQKPYIVNTRHGACKSTYC